MNPTAIGSGSTAAGEPASASPEKRSASYDLGLQGMFNGMAATSSTSSPAATLASIASTSGASQGSGATHLAGTEPGTPPPAFSYRAQSLPVTGNADGRGGGTDPPQRRARSLPGASAFAPHDDEVLGIDMTCGAPSGRHSSGLSGKAEDKAAAESMSLSSPANRGEVVHHGQLLKRRERGYFKNGFSSRYWVLRKVSSVLMSTEPTTTRLCVGYPGSLSLSPPPAAPSYQDSMMCEYPNRQAWLSGRRARRTICTAAEGTTIRWHAHGAGGGADANGSRSGSDSQQLLAIETAERCFCFRAEGGTIRPFRTPSRTLPSLRVRFGTARHADLCSWGRS